jgi:hypothetical protein
VTNDLYDVKSRKLERIFAIIGIVSILIPAIFNLQSKNPLPISNAIMFGFGGLILFCGFAIGHYIYRVYL